MLRLECIMATLACQCVLALSFQADDYVKTTASVPGNADRNWIFGQIERIGPHYAPPNGQTWHVKFIQGSGATAGTYQVSAGSLQKVRWFEHPAFAYPLMGAGMVLLVYTWFF